LGLVTAVAGRLLLGARCLAGAFSPSFTLGSFATDRPVGRPQQRGAATIAVRPCLPSQPSMTPAPASSLTLRIGQDPDINGTAGPEDKPDTQKAGDRPGRSRRAAAAWQGRAFTGVGKLPTQDLAPSAKEGDPRGLVVCCPHDRV